MNSLPRFILSLVLALALARPSFGADIGQTVAFQLQPEAKVDGSGIFLHQVLTTPFHTNAPSVRLASAPPLGQTLSLSRQQIVALAREAAPELIMTNWSGPEAVRISRRVRQLCEADVAEMIRSALQRDYVGAAGKLEIHFTRPWQPATVPEDPVTLQLTELPPAGVLPNMVAGFELWCGRERLSSWQAPLQARLWREIPVAHAPILRGQLLHEADITLERRDVLTQHDACVPFPVTDPLLEAVGNIQAGAPIWTRLTRARMVMRRGRLVEAVFQDGSMMISLKVEALEDGALGQTVRVRNPKTRRELYGKIQTEDLISIAL